MNEKNLVIGIDASTTACKAIVWNTIGEQISTGKAEISLLKPHPEWHEQSAEDWWLALVRSLRIAIENVDTDRITGMSICPQRETFVPVRSDGRPLRNAIVWMDNRARDSLPKMRKSIPDFHARSGKPLSGNLMVLKMLWLRENEPEVFSQTEKFIDVAAYLNHRLTGSFATGQGVADPTGLFDMGKQTWYSDVLDFIGVTIAQMPTVLSAGARIGQVSAAAAQECGLPDGIPVFAGLGDGQAGGLGLDITRRGSCYLSLGTSVVSGTFSENYLTDKAFRTMSAGIQGSFSLETVILGGTYTLDWFRENFAGGRAHPEFETEIQSIPPGSDGLLLVPYWNSALNPYWDPAARGMVIGWRGQHGPGHLYRAILEGIAFELRLHFEGVESALNREIKPIIAMGGGSRSDIWCQIIADVTGKTIQRTSTAEATALGAGILAAAGAGLFTSVNQAAIQMGGKIQKSFIPDPTNIQIYSRIFEDVYRHIFPDLQSRIQKLTAITG
jgi:sugar (pentulose or hexulose) kinase